MYESYLSGAITAADDIVVSGNPEGEDRRGLLPVLILSLYLFIQDLEENIFMASSHHLA